MPIFVMNVLETELTPQLVNVQPAIMMMVCLPSVQLVLMNAKNVTLTDVLPVVETESMLPKVAHVQVDIMTMLTVNVHNVTINVLNVLLINNVLFVLLIELLKIPHLAHVQLDIMKMVSLHAHNVLTNVLLVLIILPVPLVKL